MIGTRALYGGLVVVLVAVLAAACVPVTVNVTFPQQKLDDAASQIVDMSRRPAGAPASGPTPAPAPKPGSRLERWLAPLGPREASAEERPVQLALPSDVSDMRVAALRSGTGVRPAAEPHGRRDRRFMIRFPDVCDRHSIGRCYRL